MATIAWTPSDTHLARSRLCRFYRVLGTNVDGSGLGLAIVREIAEQHDALLRLGDNPRATDPGLPGTLVSVEFTHTLSAPPTLRIP